MGQFKYLIRVLSDLPNTNRVHKRIVPVDPSGRREGIKGILTRDFWIGMIYSERIHVLLGRVDAYEAAIVRALLSDYWGLLERCHPQIL
jgi:hypothetical protein